MAYEVGAGITIGGIAKAIGAIGAAAGAAVSGVQGQRAANRGKQSLNRQKTAQDQAQAAAVSQRRENDIANRRANRKKPDIAAILAGNRGGSGVGGTNITGGVSTDQLPLGSSNQLGSGGRF
jgi:hypothetical protein